MKTNPMKELSKYSVAQLCAALRDKPEVVAVTVWTDDDLRDCAETFADDNPEEVGYRQTSEVVECLSEAMKNDKELKNRLEDCAAGNECLADRAAELARTIDWN